MATTTLSLKYRPIKIGFLVRDGSIEDLVRVAGINTLLWGGIYNPVIPISATNKDFSDQLLDLFSVDALFAVSHTKEIDEIIKNNPFLRDPGHYAENIFYEDWNTKKNVLGYLDSINIVDYYWEKEFKNKPKRYKSNCVLVKWNNDDSCNNLFSILFGYFPDSYNLKDDFQNAFLKGLRSKEISIAQTGNIDSNLAKSITPINATALELDGYGGTWRGNGVFVGSENDFVDLLYFWNLRASGLTLEFLPKDQTVRFGALFIKGYIKRLDNIPNKNPNIEDWINIYYRDDHKKIQEVVKNYQGSKRFSFSHCDEVIWNGLNIKPASYYFGWQQSLASIEKNYDRYNVSVALPEKKFINSNRNRNVDSQHLAISIDSFSEFGYPGHTLKPPFIRNLNEFYSREIEFDPWRVRSEKDGIGVIIKAHDNSLSLYPISHQKLIEKIFELAEIKSKISQPGLIAKRIIEKLGGIDGGRVFKINGVRKLLKILKIDKCISTGEGTKTIWENGEFKKYEKLYIEAREKSKLTTDDVFAFLLKKDFLRAGLELICNHCKLSNWLSLKEIDDIWTCNYCGDENKTSLQLKNRGDWKFRKSGLFAKENNQEGAIPVILTLLAFLRIFDSSKFIYSPSLRLEIGNKPCEIDFCVLQYERGNKIQLGIAECKSEGQKINQQDIDNLKAVQDAMKKIKIDCYLIFAKTADSYETDEIELLKSLKNEDRKFVVLSNKELEPYHPYWEIEETEKLPEKYALDMMGMYRNSLFLYLNDKN